MKKLSFFAFSMLILLMVSCSEKELIQDPVAENIIETNSSQKILPTLKDVTFNDGRLVFKDMSHYREVIEQVKDYQDVLDQLVLQFPDFVSNDAVYESVTYEDYLANGIEAYADVMYLNEEEDGSLSQEPVISGHFRSFASEKGMVQFGDKIWKINVATVDEFDVSELSSYREGNLEAMRTLNSFDIQIQEVSRNFWKETCKSEYNVRQGFRNIRKRVTGKVHTFNYSNSWADIQANRDNRADVFTRVKHQRRIGLVWWGDKADLTISGTVTIDEDLVNTNIISQTGLVVSINGSLSNKMQYDKYDRMCNDQFCSISFQAVDMNYHAVDGQGSNSCDCIK